MFIRTVTKYKKRCKTTYIDGWEGGTKTTYWFLFIPLYTKYTLETVWS